MKQKIALAIKAILVEMAVNDTLPLDMTQLDESKFKDALKIVDDLKDALEDMTTNADEDCPNDFRTKHFKRAMEKANKLLNES